MQKKAFITKDINNSSITYDGMPLRGIQKLLRHLVLFENIDFASSIYDCSQLIERGLVLENSICCSNNEPSENYEKKAISIMSAYKSDIVRQNIEIYKDELQMLQRPYNPNHTFWEKKNHKTINRIRISDDAYLDVKRDYYDIIQNLDFLYCSITQKSTSNFLYELFNGDAILNLIGIRNNLAYACQSMEKNKSVFISNNLNNLQGKSSKKIVDDVYVLVKTSLPNEVNILPMPTTIQDVWEMRKNPAIKTFRKVLSEWNYYFETDNISAAEKIKKDIIKANHYLEKLDKYKKFSSSPYVRTGLFVAGYIPVLSNILNIYSYAEPYIVDYIDKNCNWTHINDCKGRLK